MRIKALASSILLVALGVGLHTIYEYVSFEHVEIIKKSDPHDEYYIYAKSQMSKENSDFIKIFGGKIRSITIDGVSKRCYFFYKASGKIFEGNDLIYCYEKRSNRYLGRI